MRRDFLDLKTDLESARRDASNGIYKKESDQLLKKIDFWGREFFNFFPPRNLEWFVHISKTVPSAVRSQRIVVLNPIRIHNFNPINPKDRQIYSSPRCNGVPGPNLEISGNSICSHVTGIILLYPAHMTLLAGTYEMACVAAIPRDSWIWTGIAE